MNVTTDGLFLFTIFDVTGKFFGEKQEASGTPRGGYDNSERFVCLFSSS